MDKTDQKPRLLPQIRDILARIHYRPNTIQNLPAQDSAVHLLL